MEGNVPSTSDRLFYSQQASMNAQIQLYGKAYSNS